MYGAFTDLYTECVIAVISHQVLRHQQILTLN